MNDTARQADPQLPLFAVADIDAAAPLEGDEAHHALTVLRARPGQRIQLTDGRGRLAVAVVEATGRHSVDYRVEQAWDAPPPPYELHLAVAPTKNIDRYEWMLEKCVEMGLASLTPVICARSERTTVKEDRLRRVTLAAAKQSLKSRFTRILPPTPLPDYLRSLPGDLPRHIAVCRGDDRRELSSLAAAAPRGAVLVGPEGDFADDEVAAALGAGFRPVSMGRSRLRTETAGLAACHTYYTLFP